MRNKKRKICFVLTAEFTLKAFLRNHIQLLSSEFDITVIVNTKNESLLKELGLNAHLIPLNIIRKISILHDLRALIQLIRLFSTEKYDGVHSVTPKAGLLAMIAAFVTSRKVRIHTFTGQVWANKQGFRRFFLKSLDRILAALTTHTIVDSPSQLDFLLAENVISAKKSNVFGLGSISGVDISRFKANPKVRQSIRETLKIPKDSLIYLFLGRLNADKGVLDLSKAFIQANLQNTYLLLVGPDEQDMQRKITQLFGFQHSNIRFIDYTSTPQHYMAAADVLCLPSYREGFGSVIIEAACCGIPAIASRIYGITDAVAENQTGLLHVAGDVNDICLKMQQIYANKPLYRSLAYAAQQRAIQHFDSQVITKAWYDFYGKVFS